MIGATREVIEKAEDREAFRKVVAECNLEMPRAETVTTLDQAFAFLEKIGLPAIIRPAFTLGGFGGGIAYNREEFEDQIRRGIETILAYNGPMLLHVAISREENVWPIVKPGASNTDMIDETARTAKASKEQVA